MFKITSTTSSNANPAKTYDTGIRYQDHWRALERLGNIEEKALRNHKEIAVNDSNILVVRDFNDNEGRITTVYAIVETD